MTSPGTWVLLRRKTVASSLRYTLSIYLHNVNNAFAIKSDHLWASQVALLVKNPPANAGDTGDAGSIPRSGRSPEEEMATHSSILAWRIPWIEEPSGLQSIGSHWLRYNWSDIAHTQIICNKISKLDHHFSSYFHKNAVTDMPLILYRFSLKDGTLITFLILSLRSFLRIQEYDGVSCWIFFYIHPKQQGNQC